MNSPTPLEELRQEKKRLKIVCANQEARLSETWEFAADNLLPMVVQTTTQALKNGNKSASGLATNTQTGGILGFALNTALSLAANNLSTPKEEKKAGLPEKILGKAFPVAAPIAAAVWSFAQPMLTNYVKSRVGAFFGKKKKAGG